MRGTTKEIKEKPSTEASAPAMTNMASIENFYASIRHQKSTAGVA
jgi:hypothetical protein